jgi:hypothetical protein
VIRHPALPTDPVPSVQRLGQVIDSPVLTADSRGVSTQHIAGPVSSQFISHFLYLTMAQFRSHWPVPMVIQSGHTALAVLATPFHQARPIAAPDLTDFFNRRLLSLQPNRLIAPPFPAIATFPIDPLQFFVLFLCQFKPSFCQPFIVPLCSDLSISLPSG